MIESVPRFAIGVLLGAAGATLLLSATVGARLRAGLPDDSSALLPYGSPEPSTVYDSDGTEVGRFALVRPLDGAELSPEPVIEAFLAAAEPTFYEARVERATSPLQAMRRAWQDAPPVASPLSLSLARALLAAEPVSVRRRMRVDLLSSQFDAERSVGERVASWLQWVPLCRGRRGLDRAALDCLGNPDDTWRPGEAAMVAAAAVFHLDLASDRQLLLARRDAVLDRLVRQGRLRALEVVELPPPAPLPARTVGADALSERAAVMARRMARSDFDAPVAVHTEVFGPLQSYLARQPYLNEGAWLVLDVETGAVRAVGGDPAVARAAPGFEAFALGGGDPAAAWGGPGSELFTELQRPSLHQVADVLAALARGGEHRPQRLVREIDRGNEQAWRARGRPPRRVLDAEESYLRLLDLVPEGGLRVGRFGAMRVFAHPELVGAFYGPEVPPEVRTADLVEGIYEPRAFAVPDGIALMVRGGRTVALRRDGFKPAQ